LESSDANPWGAKLGFQTNGFFQTRFIFPKDLIRLRKFSTSWGLGSGLGRMDNQLKAFEAMFRRLQPALVRYAAFQLVSTEEAHEVVQDVFLNVWNKRDRLTFDDGLKAYLYRAVRNHSINRLKRFKPDTTDIDDRVMGLPDDDNQDAQERDLRLNAIYRQMGQLPEQCREIFMMSRMEGLSHKEIAEILELSPKTVENQVGIALKKIRNGIFGKEKEELE